MVMKEEWTLDALEIKDYERDIVVVINDNSLSPQDVIKNTKQYYPSRKVFAVVKGGQS